MARRERFLSAEWSKQFEDSYGRLDAGRQAACDKAAIALIKQSSSSGLRIKPIRPDKYYKEARINSGDPILQAEHEKSHTRMRLTI